MSVTNNVVEYVEVCDKSEIILVEVSVTINRQHTPNLGRKNIRYMNKNCQERPSQRK